MADAEAAAAAADQHDPVGFRKGRLRDGSASSFRKRRVLDADTGADDRAAAVPATTNATTSDGAGGDDDDDATVVVRPDRARRAGAAAGAATPAGADVGVAYRSTRGIKAAGPEDGGATRTLDVDGAAEVAGATAAQRGSRIRAGPVRAPANVRASVRFDYQPHVCKDYKETGFCGFGDSCIYMHDRSDYKLGWQLEREWDEQQRKAAEARLHGAATADAAAQPGDDGNAAAGSTRDDVPFACLICRKPFTNPVVTHCKHYFCEACALAHYRKTPRCAACAQPTQGIFTAAKGTGVCVRADERTMRGVLRRPLRRGDAELLARMQKLRTARDGGDRGDGSLREAPAP